MKFGSRPTMSVYFIDYSMKYFIVDQFVSAMKYVTILKRTVDRNDFKYFSYYHMCLLHREKFAIYYPCSVGCLIIVSCINGIPRIPMVLTG